MDSIQPQTISERIRGLLAERGMSQAELARKSGLDRTVLSRLLNGKRAWSLDAHLAFVAPVLEVDVDKLLEGTFEAGIEASRQAVASQERDDASELLVQLQEARIERDAVLQENARLKAALRAALPEADAERLRESEKRAAERVRSAEARERNLGELLAGERAQIQTLRAELAHRDAQVAQLRDYSKKATKAAQQNYRAVLSYRQHAKANGWNGALLGAAAVGLLALAVTSR